MKNITVLFSAERSTLSVVQNSIRTDELRGHLVAMGFPFVTCKGVYEGSTENSFAVPTTSNLLSCLTELANDYEQDCVLVVDRDSHDATLVWGNDDENTKIGKWCRVSYKEAHGDDHTWFPSANAYYRVK